MPINLQSNDFRETRGTEVTNTSSTLSKLMSRIKAHIYYTTYINNGFRDKRYYYYFFFRYSLPKTILYLTMSFYPNNLFKNQ